MVLGAQLRKLREAAGITCEEAGETIRASHSKISRMELGRVRFRDRDVADLLAFYGVRDPETRDALLALAHNANATGWWHRYGEVLPSWFEMYVGLEEAATRIRSYEVQFVPGLFQIPEYAHAVTRLGHPEATHEEIERRVELRTRRQKILSGDHQVWAVIDEAALQRPLGGPDIMRRQLDHLAEVGERPNVTIQVVPFAVGGHAAAGGPFTILRFGEPDLPDVVYLEQLTSALYLERRTDVDHYLAVMEAICVQAAPVHATPEILHRIKGQVRSV
jgi:hypothetical protein